MDYIRLKTRIIGDVRFARFQRALGVSRATALGSLAMVHMAWAQTEDDVLSAEDVDHAGECLGIAQAMLAAGLAETVGDGRLRIRGAREELDNMLKKRDRGKKGADARWHINSGISTMPKQCGSNAYADGEKRREEKRIGEERVASHDATTPIYPTGNSDSRKPANHPEPSDEAHELAMLLATSIRAHTPEAVIDVSVAASKWARDIDLAMRVDGRAAHLLRECIEFAHASNETFWRANILSGKKLRAQVPTLVTQMRAGRGAAADRRLTGDELRAMAKRMGSEK